MAAFDKVKGKRSGCKGTVESTNEFPATLQKSTFPCGRAINALDCPLASFEQVKSSRNQREEMKKGLDALGVLRHQISAVNTTMLQRRPGTAPTAHEGEPNTGDSGRLVVSKGHAGKDIYPAVKELPTEKTNATSETRPESRSRRKKHLMDLPSLPRPTGTKAAAGNASCNSELLCCAGPHEKAKKVASPASMTSDEAHGLASQEKSTIHTQCGTSPHTLQLSQSSTSATPPPSECSSDESPYSPPQACEEVTFRRGGPLASAGAAPAASLEEAEVARSGTPQDSVYVPTEQNIMREESVKRRSIDKSISNSSNAGLSPVLNWSFTPEKNTHKTKRGGVQGRKHKKHNGHKGRSPGGDRGKIEKNHIRRNCSSHGVAEHSSEQSGKRLTTAAALMLSGSSGMSQRSGGHDTTHQRPLHEIQQILQAPPPPPPPPSPHPSPALTIPAGSSGYAPAPIRSPPAADCRTDVEDASPALSAWRCLSPDRSRGIRRSLQGRRTIEDALIWEIQDGDKLDKLVQKHLDGADLLIDDLYRWSGGSLCGKTTQHGGICRFNPVGPGERVQSYRGLPDGEKRAEADEVAADTLTFSEKQSFEATPPSGFKAFSRALESCSNELNANTTPTGAASSPMCQPPPPPPSILHPLPYLPAPPSHLDRAADMARGVRNVEASNTTLYPFAPCTNRAREVEKTLSSNLNAFSQTAGDIYEDVHQPPSRPPISGKPGYNFAKVVQHAIAGGVSPKAGNHARPRGERTKNGSSGKKAAAREWMNTDPETNGFTFSSAESTASHLKAGSAILSSSLSIPDRLHAFSGDTGGEKAEEGERHRLASMQHVHSHTPGRLLTPNPEWGPDRRITTAPAPAPRSRQSSGRNNTTVANRFALHSVRAREERPRESQLNGGAESPCQEKWCCTPPAFTQQECNITAGATYSLNETTLSSPLPSDGSFALLREQQQQPWLKLPSTCSSQSPCRPSHYCEHATGATRWSPALANSEPSGSLFNNSFVEGGGHKPELLTISPNNYASRPAGQYSNISVVGCHLPPKHLPHLGRQEVSSGAQEDMHNAGDCCFDYCKRALVFDGAVGLPRSIRGTNSGVLWGVHVPPISVLLTLPLNLPYGKIMKFGSPSVPSQTGIVMPPPPPPAELNFVGNDGQQQTSLCGLTSERPAVTRSLGAKKSYYHFSPILQEGAHTLFSHAGGICDTFAASLHLELAILYVPPPLLPHVASMFQALRPRLPRFTSALRLECGGLEERNAPGRFGGKVLTVSCAVEDPQERYKFQQMQEFLMLFQSKVEVLLREYALQQQLLLGYRPTSNGQQKGAAIPGKKHNIWRYAMSCLPSSLSSRQGLAQTMSTEKNLSSEISPDNLKNQEVGACPSEAVTQGESATGSGSTSGTGSTGSGFVDLTIRAFEAKALDKATKEYARTLVVNDVCISEIRLVTTRGIEDKTCEIDPRYPQYSIGTRPIVLAPDGQLCRHSLVDVHVLPDVWEVRLRPGNTRDEQKRLVERCMLAAIENKPLHVQNEALKAAIDAGVILWVNGEIMLLPAPPVLALEDGEKEKEKHHERQQEEKGEQSKKRVESRYEAGELQQTEQAASTVKSPEFHNDDRLRPRECAKNSTPTLHLQGETSIRAAACCFSRKQMSSSFSPLQERDFFGDLLLVGSHGSTLDTSHGLHEKEDAQLSAEDPNVDGKAPESATPFCRRRGSTHVYGKNAPQSTAGSPRGYDLLVANRCHSPAPRSRVEPFCQTQADVPLTSFSFIGTENEHSTSEQDGDRRCDYQPSSQPHRGPTMKCLESFAAAMAAVPPGLDIHEEERQDRGTTIDTLYAPPEAMLQQTRAPGNLPSDSQLRQAHEFLEVLASGWAHPPQQRQAAANVAVKELHKETKPETQGGEEENATVKKSVSNSALQHVPGAMQLLQQLQDAIRGIRLHMGATREDTVPAESSVVRKTPSSVPAWSSESEWAVHGDQQGGLQEYHQREIIDCHPIPSCGRRNGVMYDSSRHSKSAAAVLAARRMLTRDHSAVMDLAKLLDSENNSNVYKTTTAGPAVDSRHRGSFLRGQKESDAVVYSEYNDGDNVPRTNRLQSGSNGGETSLTGGRRLAREAEEVGEQGDEGALYHDGGDDCRGTWPSKIAGSPAWCARQGGSSSAGVAHKNFRNTDLPTAATLADTACNWGAHSDDYSSALSELREQGNTVAFSEQLPQREHELQPSYAASREVLGMQSPAGRQLSTGSSVSQHVRSRVGQRHPDGKSMSHCYLQSQHLTHDHAHALPQREDNVQQTAAEGLREKHELELSRCSSDPSGIYICSQGFPSGDLLQQYECTTSLGKEFVTSGKGWGAARKLLEECGSDGTPSQQRENGRNTFFDSYVEGLELRYGQS